MDEKFQNISEFTCMRSSERRCKLSEYFLSISEKCSNSYKDYKKNFYQGIKNQNYNCLIKLLSAM